MANKQNLIDKISEKSGFTKKDTSLFLATFIDAVEETLSSGEEIAITDFGKFTVVERAERIGRNPKTGDEIKIEKSKSVKFKVGKKLKDKVNK